MGEPFLLGVNDFYDGRLHGVSQEAVEDRLKRITELGAKTVRFLLPWREIQPESGRIPDSALRWLESYLDKAKSSGLHVVPVFFCGRLGESNWLPHWVCGTPLLDPKPLDFYRERDLIRAQQLQIDVVVGAFAGHEAVVGWDLGRETSALAPAPDPDAARSRLLWLVEALKRRDETHRITLTLSPIDLEEDRGMRPAGLAEELDFLSLRIHPEEISRAEHANDAAGFYCVLTHALCGKPVLISELVVEDDDATRERLEATLEDVQRSGVVGVIVWNDACVLDSRAAETFHRFAVSRPGQFETPPGIRVDEQSFYADPEAGLRNAYEAYRKERDSRENSDDPGLVTP